MTRTKLLVATATLFLFALASSASLNPNLQKGFAADKAYSIGDVDSVNLFNGNLNVSIPIGISYPVGPVLSYQFMLTNTGKVWDYKQHIYPTTYKTEAIPSEESNAGYGWIFGLGYFRPTPNDDGAHIYVSPDGGWHRFYDSLPAHNAAPSKPGWEGRQEYESNLVYFTRDSTYLRLVRSTSGFPFRVDFPNGVKHYFDAQGRLRKMVDPAGQWVKVIPISTGFRIEDSHNRKHWVTLDSNGFVESVKLSTFGGQTSVYNFNYYVNNEWPLPSDDTYSSFDRRRIWFLGEVTQPSNAPSWKMLAYVDPDAHPDTGKASGFLKSLKLPTGATITWEYQNWNLNDSAGQIDLDNGHKDFLNFVRAVPGVISRIVDTGVQGGIRTWSYESTGLNPVGLPDGGMDFTKRTTTVTYPQVGGRRDKWIHHFNTIDELHHGLPYDPTEGCGAGCYGNLSVEVFRGNESSPERETYVEYEWDEGAVNNLIEAQNNNRRQKASSIRYDDNSISSQVRSNWNVLGHYESLEENSTFGPTRTTDTIYDGALPGASNSTSPWLLNRYKEVQVTENSQTARSLFCFNAASGLLTKKRVLAGATPATIDHLVFYKRAGGFVVDEKYYGGDANNNAPGQGSAYLCDVSESGTPVYWLKHTTSNGVRATSKYVNPGTGGGQIGGMVLDQTIDTTGLVSSSRDGNGINTSFQYDALGRVTRISPAGLGRTDLTYQTYSSFELPSVTLKFNSSPTEALNYLMTFEYNGLGQIVKEWRNQYNTEGPVSAIRDTKYNLRGWKDSVSPWGGGSQGGNKYTRYTQYDPFGRPGNIKLPDNQSTILEYDGVQTLRRRVNVWTDQGWTQTTTTEHYDHSGRLKNVQDPYGQTTYYQYNVLGKLASVDQGIQHRSFNYDLRGFLDSETHPESGTTEYKEHDVLGNPGEIWKGTDAPTPVEVKLEYDYDSAGRVKTVKDLLGNRTLLSYVYDAYKNRVGSATRTAFLDTMHILELSPDEVPIVESYSYGDHGLVTRRDTSIWGTFSFKQEWTYTDLGEVRTIKYPRCVSGSEACPSNLQNRTVEYVYDKGSVSQIRQTTPSTEAYADLTYWLNGLVRTVQHSNGITDHIDITNQDRMARPYRMWFTNVTENTPENFSGYQYDGAGNLYGFSCPNNGDSASFTYDKLSRLKSFRHCGSDLQSYLYDQYGNLTRITTDGTYYPIDVDPQTNRYNRSDAVYSKRGNLESWSDNDYTWDPLDSLIAIEREDAPGGTPINADERNRVHQYLYTADGERIGIFSAFPGPVDVTRTILLRDLDGQILTEYELSASTGLLTWKKDYIYRGKGQLLAVEEAGGVEKHFTLDHLGTPTVISDANGNYQGNFQFLWPYGELRVAPSTPEKRKLTGHVRDDNWESAGYYDSKLDYLHARYYSPHLGRFLSVDPKARRGALKTTQGWNQYAYAAGNPFKFTDPDGLAVKHFTLLTEGPNNVPLRRIPDLGLEQTPAGFHLNTNVQIDFDAGDDLGSYRIERDAAVLLPKQKWQTGPKENPDDPEHVKRTGASIFVYDGPGLTQYFNGKPAGRSLGSGDYVSLYELRVVNNKTNAPDPKSFFYAIIISYEKGRAVRYVTKVLTEEQFRMKVQVPEPE